jgi:hypothetical protein
VVDLIGGLDSNGAVQSAVLEFSAFANPTPPLGSGNPTGVWTVRGNLATARFGLQTSEPPHVAWFEPVANAGRDERLDAIAAWVAGVRSVRASPRLDAARINAGRNAFTQVGLAVPGMSCASCHAGPKWTRSRVRFAAPPSPDLSVGPQRIIGPELRIDNGVNALVDVGTFPAAGFPSAIRVSPADESQTLAPLGANGFNIPSLLSLSETAPYLHDGSAPGLMEVLNGTHDTSGAPQVHFVVDPVARAALVEFLRSIDETTTPIP